jgi:glutamate dehydrogenase (NAD(P)+)
MFVRAGAIVVAISTRRGGLHNPLGLDVAAVGERIRAGGEATVADSGLGGRIAASDLKFVPADILCPCARHDSITLDDAGAVGATVISCGANSPVTPAAERRLWERGILCVPDFVANSGGVLGGTMEFAGWRPGEIVEFCDRRFRPRVASMIREAVEAGRPLREVAEAFALRRFAGVKRLAEQDSWRRGGLDAALAAYREGWVPGRLVRWLSAGYFGRRVG